MVKKYENPENLQTALDCAVRDYEGKTGGFEMNNNGVTYCNYMTNAEWEKFLGEMSEEHKRQFDDGAGGELKAGKYPPKMASYGSSVLNLSKTIVIVLPLILPLTLPSNIP